MCVLSVRLLPAVERSVTESADEFSGRIQRLIASSLNISATSFTSADKMDLIKRLHARWPGLGPYHAHSRRVQLFSVEFYFGDWLCLCLDTRRSTNSRLGCYMHRSSVSPGVTCIDGQRTPRYYSTVAHRMGSSGIKCNRHKNQCMENYNKIDETHTHTHLAALCPVTTRMSWYQKGKTNLYFTGARDG